MTVLIIGFAAFLLYILQLNFLKHHWDRNLKILLRFESSSMQEGEKGWLTEVIENRKYLPLPMLKVKFQCAKALAFSDAGEAEVTDFYYRNDIFTVMPYRKITRRLEFTAKKRGYYVIHGMDIIAADLFLSKEFHKKETSDTVCVVYPRPLERRLVLPVLQQAQGEILSKRQYLEDPFEYRGIREYQPYDELKQVNWKATARTGGLKVNEQGYTTRQAVRIFLNLSDKGKRKHEEAVEDTIRLCVTLCTELLAEGNRVAVYANSPDCLTGEALRLSANTGQTHFINILHGLARLDTKQDALDFVASFEQVLWRDRENFMTFFLTANPEEDFKELVARYGKVSTDYRVLQVTEGEVWNW